MTWQIFKNSKKTIPVIRFEGIIASSAGRTYRGGAISLEGMRLAIDKAFAAPRAPFIVLVINSPGGSPVQSALIGRYIRMKAAQKKIAVYAFCEDVAASGGYWLAASADIIYAMPASVVGSIGVISHMFGFPELIRKIGVERRVYTSGQSKNQLDPFLPENQAQVAHLKQVQENIHQDFIDWVQHRRGKKLSDDPEIFSGKFYDGTEALKLGLVDEISGLDDFLFEKFGQKYQIKPFGAQRRSFMRLLGFEHMLASGLEMIVNRIEEKLARAHFGL